ncbi:unnamed protein product [Arctogadus glacialis]
MASAGFASSTSGFDCCPSPTIAFAGFASSRKYQNRRMSFPGPEYPLRTDISFNLKVDELHHHESPFYTYPFNSDRMNIFVVNDASDELKSVEVSALSQKCVALPYRDGFVAIPLLQ